MLDLSTLRSSCIDGATEYVFTKVTPTDETLPIAGATASTVFEFSDRLSAGFYNVEGMVNFLYSQDEPFIVSALHINLQLNYQLATSTNTVHVVNTNNFVNSKILVDKMIYIPENLGSFSVVFQADEFDGDFVIGSDATNAGMANIPTYTRNNVNDYFTLRKVF